MYDSFVNINHSDTIKKIMVANNKRLINYLLKFFPGRNRIKVLEIGPGKGYFYQASRELCAEKCDICDIEYYALDQNETILQNLGISSSNLFRASLPKLEFEDKFDLIFAGYVIEHLNNPCDLYDSLTSLKRHLNKNGVIVLQFPDCMKMGMEFYNIDYTHSYPTTKRRVNQAVNDCGMRVVKSVDICGLLYTKKVDSRLGYAIKRVLTALYNYKIVSAVFSALFFYKKPDWDLENLPWRVYALLKEPNAMFIIKKKKR